MRWLVWFCLLGLLLPWLSPWVAAWGGGIGWLLDQVSHWQWAFVMGLGFSAAVLGFSHRRWWLALLALPLPWYSASPILAAATEVGRQLTVASANVRESNQDVQALAQWLRAEVPDLVVVLEVSPEYALGLATLPGYPYRKVIAERSPFGMAVLSRLPLVGTQVVRDASGVPRIETRVQWGERRVRLTAFHPVPPVSPAYRRARDMQIQSAVATSAQTDASNPALVVGDFNGTPWSSAFGGIAGSGWRRATGLSPTWPAVTGGWFGLPIDHVLASPHWRLEASTLGPPLGSDHLPILVRLSVPPVPRASQASRTDAALSLSSQPL